MTETVRFSNAAMDCIDAMARGDRSTDPRYDAARKAAKRIERHEVTERPGYVYTVTTIAAGAVYGGTRTVAACSTFDKADEMIRGNYGDLFECSYGLAVVEECPLDSLYGAAYPGEFGHWWYTWTGDARDGCYVPIETPAEYADECGFGIG